MKIVAIADQHGLLDAKIPECDLLIVAGDLCPDRIGPFWARDDARQQYWWFANEWLAWREAQPAEHCLVTWGNHDYCGHLQGSHIENYQDGKTQVGIDALVEYKGLKIWLSPWTKQFMKWAFMKEEQDLWDKHFNRIPEGIDILVTHDPPYGYGDASPDWETKKIDHYGSVAMLKTVLRVKPKVVICGHIHDAYGTYTLTGNNGLDLRNEPVTIYNCAMATGRATLGTLVSADRRPMEFEL